MPWSTAGGRRLLCDLHVGPAQVRTNWEGVGARAAGGRGQGWQAEHRARDLGLELGVSGTCPGSGTRTAGGMPQR
jgi:hypothetical protein